MPHYAPSVTEQNLRFDHTGARSPTDLSFIKGSIFSKLVQQQSELGFELGEGIGIDVPRERRYKRISSAR